MIDEFLEEIEVGEVSPSDQLVVNTKESYKNIKKNNFNFDFDKAFLKIAPLAVILIVATIIFYGQGGTALFGEEDTAYYTVDINPSIGFNVDEKEKVIAVDFLNEDAEKLYIEIDFKGMDVSEAILLVIDMAEEGGYLDGEEKYVLVGRFDEDGADSDIALETLQNNLEANLGDMINLVFIEGSEEEKDEAIEQEVSPGLLQLSKLAEKVQLQAGEKVEEVITEVNEENEINYIAPTISSKENGNGFSLTWNKLNFNEIGYAGKVTYKVVMADNEDSINNFDAEVIKSFKFDATLGQSSSLNLSRGDYDLEANESAYFAIYAIYNEDTYKVSNIIKVTMPEEEKENNQPEDDEEEPETGKNENPEYKLEGSATGSKISLSWSEAPGDYFEGYKVVASKTDSTPTYPEDTYVTYITNRSTTSYEFSDSDKLDGNTNYYFSITYIYADSDYEYANTVQLKTPNKKIEDDDDEPTSNNPTNVGTTVRADQDGNHVNVYWDKIEDPDFSGYKVVYSYSNNAPYYRQSGTYYATYITNASTTSYSFNLGEKDGYQANSDVYVSVSVLYGDTVKKGNAIKFKTEDIEIEEVDESTLPTSTIQGSINENNIISLSWNKIENDNLDGYKVVYSFTDTTPVYGESYDGYKWYTDPNKTSLEISASELNGFESHEGENVYFSITALYYGHDYKKAGNAITLRTVVTEDEEDNEELEAAKGEFRDNILAIIDAVEAQMLQEGEASLSNEFMIAVVDEGNTEEGTIAELGETFSNLDGNWRYDRTTKKTTITNVTDGELFVEVAHSEMSKESIEVSVITN